MDKDLIGKWGVAVRMNGRWEEALCSNKREAGATLESLMRDYGKNIEDIRIVSPQEPEEEGSSGPAKNPAIQIESRDDREIFQTDTPL